GRPAAHQGTLKTYIGFIIFADKKAGALPRRSWLRLFATLGISQHFHLNDEVALHGLQHARSIHLAALDNKVKEFVGHADGQHTARHAAGTVLVRVLESSPNASILFCNPGSVFSRGGLLLLELSSRPFLPVGVCRRATNRLGYL